MTIEKLDETKLLISLCNKDMEKLAITPDTMNMSDPDFKDTVKAILSLAVYESGISTKGRTAVIEALPYENGCFLLVSFVSKDGHGKKYRVIKRTEAVFLFDSLESLIALANAIGSNPRIGDNTVLEYHNRYFLLVRDLPPGLDKQIREFALRIRTKSVQLSRYKEYGNIIAEHNALCKLKNVFIG